MKFFYLLCLVSILLFSEDMPYNYSFKKTIIKQKSNKSNKKCALYVEINGNEDWEKKKYELNTIINNSNKCRVINIYKSIRNVHTRKGKNSDSAYEINIGTILKKNKNLKIKTILIIENSNLKNGYSPSQINIGNSINSNYINNIEIKSSMIINNSSLGAQSEQDFGINNNHKNKMGERSLNFDK